MENFAQTQEWTGTAIAYVEVESNDRTDPHGCRLPVIARFVCGFDILNLARWLSTAEHL